MLLAAASNPLAAQLIAWLILLSIYMSPSIVGHFRHYKKMPKLIIANIVLGMTLIALPILLVYVIVKTRVTSTQTSFGQIAQPTGDSTALGSPAKSKAGRQPKTSQTSFSQIAHRISDIRDQKIFARALNRYNAELNIWQEERQDLLDTIEMAKTGKGIRPDDLNLLPGETVFLVITSVSLIEIKKGPSTYVGKSSGISVPVAKIGGRTIRYRVGKTKGHVVSGTPYPEATDKGDFYITSQRLIYIGAQKTATTELSKMIAATIEAGTITISSTSRVKPTTITYGAHLDNRVRQSIIIAQGWHHNDPTSAVEELNQELLTLEKRKPQIPPTPK